MKSTFKVLIGTGAFIILAVAAIFAINFTDQALTEKTQQALQKYPEVPGYSLKQFRSQEFKNMPSPEIEDLKDYKDKKETVDAALSKYEPQLKALLEAFNQGKVEVVAGQDFENIGFYPYTLHKYFILLMSQKALSGQLPSVLETVEKSNNFLKSIIQTPQVLIGKKAALAALKLNSKLISELKEQGLVKSIPASLKQSFVIDQSADEILKSALSFEFLITAKLISNEKSFIRPNQTLNWYSEIVDQSMGCREGQELEQCSDVYQNEISQAGLKFYLVNPTGRGIIKLLAPRLAGVSSEIKKKKVELAEQISSL